MGRIAIFKEKHGTRYFDLTQCGGWSRVCMSILLDRSRDPYWGYPLKEPKAPQKPGKPEGLDDLKAVEKYLKAEKKYPALLKSYEVELGMYKLLQKALEGNLRAASEFIELRSNHEHEGYTIETTEKPPDTVPNWMYPLSVQAGAFKEAVWTALDALYTDEQDAALAVFPALIAKYRATTTTGRTITPLAFPEDDVDYEKSTLFLIMAMERLMESTDLRSQHRVIKDILRDAETPYPQESMQNLLRRRFEHYGDLMAYARSTFLADHRREPKNNYSDNVAMDRIIKGLRARLQD